MFSLRPFRLIAASVAVFCAGGWPGELAAVPVRVATYNIENGIAAPGTAKYEAAKAVLARIDADVIAFQELLRDSSTVAWEQNWRQLAAELGYLAAFDPAGTTLSGSQRLGYFSRFPIQEVAHVRSPQGANEMTRLPMRVVLEVPGAAKPLVLWNMHHKANEGTDPVLLERNQFRRAVEAIRIAQDINSYVAANPDHDEFVVLGDLNADVFSEPQASFFHTIPSGLPTSYALGADITFPVAYQPFPDGGYAAAGGGMQRLDAFQANSTIRYTYPSWPSVLDYVVVSAALYQGPAGPPVGEVYNSLQDASFPNAGLPKAGSPPVWSASRTASDHLAVFVDLDMEDELGPGWTVSPETAWAPQGFAGGPFTPAQQTYMLENPLAEAVRWSVQANVPWLQISTMGGTLAGGAAETVQVTIDSVQVPTVPGVYFGALSWQDEGGEGAVTRRVVLSVLQPGRIAVSPAAPALVAGPPGGPFSPSTTTYTISNPGQGPVTWTASNDAPWVTLETASGQLAPGESVNVTATVNEAANVLPLGAQTATLTFGDGNAPGVPVTRTLQLEVRVRDYLTRPWSNATELAGRSFTFAPDSSDDRYFVRTEAASAFPSDPAGDAVLTLGDDSFVALDVAGAVSIPFFGTPYARVFVGSNGYLTFGSGDTTFTRSLANHFGRPRVSGLFTDLDPSRGGTISWRQWSDRLAVTYQNVPEYGQTNANSFQVELFFDGRIRVTYLRVDAPAAITGLSAGSGLPVDFTASDFLGYPLATDQPWGQLAASGVTTTTALLTTPVLPADRSGFTAHGYVLARAALQLLPALGDPSSGAIDFEGAPPETLAVLVEALDPDTRYAVRAYAVRDGQTIYSATREFTTASAAAPYYETGFEGVSRGSYATFNLTIDGLVWTLDDALIGTDANDLKNGSRAVRVRNGSLSMTGFLNQGAGEVRFLFGRSNFSGDRTGNAPVFVVEYATAQAPDVWTAVGSPVSLAGIDELTLFAARVDVPGEVRFRVRKVGGDLNKRWNIDDFAVTPYGGAGTGPVVIGSDLEAAGRVGEGFDYVIPVEGQAQFFEMETVPPGLTLNTATGRLAGVPLLAGSYELTVVAGNEAGVDSATLLVDIARGRPVVRETPVASAIFAGQTLADSVLTGGVASVAGTFVFGDSSLQPGAGINLQPVTFLPDDRQNYDPVEIAVSVEVTSERPFAEVTLGGLDTVYDGTPRAVAVTTVPAGLAIEVTYEGLTGPPVEAGVYEVTAVVTEEPYLGSASGSLVVNRATPQVGELPAASALNEGQTLRESALTGGAADVPGVFVFAEIAAVPAAGVTSVEVLFIPSDARNYATVLALVEMTVLPAPVAVAITFDGLTAVYDGQPKPVSIQTEPDGVAVRVTYDGVPEAPVGAGSYAVEVVVESEGYSGQSAATLVIARATPSVLSPPVVEPLTSGQALSAGVLAGGSASVPGDFTFNLPATVPPDGTTSHAVIFAPDESANYESVTLPVEVTVVPVLPAGPVVAAWNLARQPGNQPSSPGAGAEGIEALPLGRGAGLQPVTAANSIIGNGWNEGDDNHFTFGFTVPEGLAVDLDALQIGTRSSGGGPARLALRWSVDNFATDLAAWDQSPDVFRNQIISLAGLASVQGRVEFRIVAVDSASASGGALSTMGTSRLANYFAEGADTGWLGFTGTVQEIPVLVAPVINSPLTAGATVGEIFSYQITTTEEAAADSFAAAPLPAGLSLEPSEGLISGTPAAAGVFNIVLTATNAAGTDLQTLVLTVEAADGSSDYDTWALNYGLTGENARLEADPDGDGFSNAQEYAFGTDPTLGNGSLVSTSTADGNLTVTWLERSDVTYIVQSTADLATTAFANDSTVTVEAGAAEPAPPEGYARKQFTVPAGGSKFYWVTASVSSP